MKNGEKRIHNNNVKHSLILAELDFKETVT